MSNDIVITEKSSQARDVRAALGNRYGAILPAEGHLITLLEPEEVNPRLEALVRGSAPPGRALRDQTGERRKQGR